jgi:hypothetical protein
VIAVVNQSAPVGRPKARFADERVHQSRTQLQVLMIGARFRRHRVSSGTWQGSAASRLAPGSFQCAGLAGKPAGYDGWRKRTRAALQLWKYREIDWTSSACRRPIDDPGLGADLVQVLQGGRRARTRRFVRDWRTDAYLTSLRAGRCPPAVRCEWNGEQPEDRMWGLRLELTEAPSDLAEYLEQFPAYVREPGRLRWTWRDATMGSVLVEVATTGESRHWITVRTDACSNTARERATVLARRLQGHYGARSTLTWLG